MVIDAALEARVAETAAAIRALFERPTAPPPVADTRRCGECSLREICQPDLLRASGRLERLAATLFEPDDAGESPP